MDNMVSVALDSLVRMPEVTWLASTICLAALKPLGSNPPCEGALWIGRLWSLAPAITYHLRGEWPWSGLLKLFLSPDSKRKVENCYFRTGVMQINCLARCKASRKPWPLESHRRGQELSMSCPTLYPYRPAEHPGDHTECSHPGLEFPSHHQRKDEMPQEQG